MGGRNKTVLMAAVLMLTIIMSAPNIHGQNAPYKPGTELKQLATEYFDFVYSSDSKAAALYIASFADKSYLKLNELFKSTYWRRYLVYVTTQYQAANGLTNPTFHPSIIVYAWAPSLDSSIGNSRDWLKYVFYHELVHAVTLGMMNGIQNISSYLFGNLGGNNDLLPSFMIEGVTVSLESAMEEGYGRTNDPYVLQQLRQDIFEGKFKTPDQAAVQYDSYPGGNVFYWYGGLFGRFLQEKYGVENYARLFRDNICYLPFTFPILFQSVYGISLWQAWDDFREWVSYTGKIADIPAENLLTPKNGLVTSPVLAKIEGISFIYFIDGTDHTVKRLNVSTRSVEILFGTDSSAYALALSADGKYCALSHYVYSGMLPKATVSIYDLGAKRYLPASWTGVEQVSFLSNGTLTCIGIRMNGLGEDLVTATLLPDGSFGEEKVLLAGSENLVISTPKEYLQHEIAFLAQINGTRTIGLLDTESGETKYLRTNLGYIRTIGVYAGKLLFGYADRESFYRAAIFDGSALHVQRETFSGGVLSPMLAGTDIYCLARFSDGRALVKLPVSADSFDRIEGTDWFYPSAPEKTEYEKGSKAIVEQPYCHFWYTLPVFWAPWAGSTLITPILYGGKILGQDPWDINSYDLQILTNGEAVDIDFHWDNYSLYPLTFGASYTDQYAYLPFFADTARERVASISVGYDAVLQPLYAKWLFGASAACRFIALESLQTGYNPYSYTVPPSEWVDTLSVYNVGVSIGFSAMDTLPGIFKKVGWQITGWGDIAMAADGTLEFKTEGQFEAGLGFIPVFPALFRMNVAWCNAPELNLGGETGLFGAAQYPAYEEYSSIVTRKGSILVMGELTSLLFDLEIQGGLLLLPIYLARAYTFVGYRFAVFDGDFMHSLFAKLSIGLQLGYKEPFLVNIEGTYAISLNRWDLFLSFSYSLPI